MNQRMDREYILNEIAHTLLLKQTVDHPFRVGVDGGSASGKTVFANELAEVLRNMGKSVIRAGIDGFHNPPEIRYRKGAMSVVGYVEDSFNFAAIHDSILTPLGPGGSLEFSREVFDHHSESDKEFVKETAQTDSILIFEGVMLFRPELINGFDYKIKIYTTPEVKLERAKVRDLQKFGSMETLVQKYTRRFLPGQALYRKLYEPLKSADVIVHNDDPSNPTLTWRTGAQDF